MVLCNFERESCWKVTFTDGALYNCRYGDSLWLQILPGSGELRWQNGSVLGTKLERAHTLPTVPLDPKTQMLQHVRKSQAPLEQSGAMRRRSILVYNEFVSLLHVCLTVCRSLRTPTCVWAIPSLSKRPSHAARMRS